MKQVILFILLLSVVFSSRVFADVKGEIVEEKGNLTVVKVWGSHYERGYAYGYLMGDEIKELCEGYIMPIFGIYLPQVKSLVVSKDNFNIQDKYIDEAKGIYEGMKDAGYQIKNIDYRDILVANTLLDIIGFVNNMGCSSLLSWGKATAGTDEAGKAIITRHLDWSNEDALVKHQVIVIHIPNEKNEQPWAMIGFAGMMTSLSGINANGVSAFQHVMGDFDEDWTINPPYTPIWFALRDALETYDYNSDGKHNTNDVRSALNDSKNGFADSYIVSSLASSDQEADSLIAMIAEIAPTAPKYVYRNSSYDDDIPGDNIYTANSQIARNDSRNYCERYDAIKKNFGDGTGIDRDESWNRMSSYSNSGKGNLQMMQYSPEDMILRLAVYQDDTPAYKNDYSEYNLAKLFKPYSDVEDENIAQTKSIIYPNPAEEFIYFNLSGKPDITIYDEAGNLILKSSGTYLSVASLTSGVYVAVIDDGRNIKHEVFVKK